MPQLIASKQKKSVWSLIRSSLSGEQQDLTSMNISRAVMLLAIP
jgi:hypothetical protein